MIQRIQTVYLLFVFCLMATIVFYPFSTFWMTSGVAVLVAIVAVITIFLYKKRNLQIRYCYVMLLLLISIYFFDGANRQYLPLTEFFQHIRFTFVFPFIAIILVLLSLIGIKKDEKLVRSLDRLR